MSGGCLHLDCFVVPPRNDESPCPVIANEVKLSGRCLATSSLHSQTTGIIQRHCERSEAIRAQARTWIVSLRSDDNGAEACP
ncbi:MAG: hypothetical protein LBJ47_09535, partial [Tannerella sp.]|nr:hypothetical protein [Tannerella sp.]